MTLEASINPKDDNEVLVKVPVTRWDILHACDIMEDVAIAYGYDNLPKKMPGVNTVATALPINKMSDHARRELALAGFTEVAPLILVKNNNNNNNIYCFFFVFVFPYLFFIFICINSVLMMKTSNS